MAAKHCLSVQCIVVDIVPLIALLLNTLAMPVQVMPIKLLIIKIVHYDSEFIFHITSMFYKSSHFKYICHILYYLIITALNIMVPICVLKSVQ
jgi:hypothetical protein